MDNTRNIDKHELYYRYDYSTRSWVLKSEEKSHIDERTLWLDDIFAQYNNGFTRPLVSGYAGMIYNDRRIIGICSLIGSIAQTITIYTEG